MSIMDLAYHLKIIPNLFAVCRNHLADREGDVPSFKNVDIFLQGEGAIQMCYQEDKDTH